MHWIRASVGGVSLSAGRWTSRRGEGCDEVSFIKRKSLVRARQHVSRAVPVDDKASSLHWRSFSKLHCTGSERSSVQVITIGAPPVQNANASFVLSKHRASKLSMATYFSTVSVGSCILMFRFRFIGCEGEKWNHILFYSVPKSFFVAEMTISRFLQHMRCVKCAINTIFLREIWTRTKRGASRFIFITNHFWI